MPETNQSLSDRKKQHDDFMALLETGAHLDTTFLPIEPYLVGLSNIRDVTLPVASVHRKS
ncbi:membrane protein [Novimethylophilus kurashikiensis]|uniref:Membrane protein n=1 Tax=Novimethylophilus kurashikiensis TaxID=1825523 RepID=A0A2R5F8E8_9PROT|nr:hypothetical protein [Novimethylophilus kurashikiensis]GBG14305.1 membrane protein [Novimethylophilus kurashikiensis]